MRYLSGKGTGRRRGPGAPIRRRRRGRAAAQSRASRACPLPGPSAEGPAADGGRRGARTSVPHAESSAGVEPLAPLVLALVSSPVPLAPAPAHDVARATRLAAAAVQRGDLVRHRASLPATALLAVRAARRPRAGSRAGGEAGARRARGVARSRRAAEARRAGQCGAARSAGRKSGEGGHQSRAKIGQKIGGGGSHRDRIHYGSFSRSVHEAPGVHCPVPMIHSERIPAHR